MKKIFIYLYMLSFNIATIAMNNATKTITLKTLIQNTLTGNKTFTANAYIPIIQNNNGCFLVNGSGPIKKMTVECQVDKKNILNIHSWAEDFTQEQKKLAENFKQNKKELYKCLLCDAPNQKSSLIGLNCCNRENEIKIICVTCKNNIIMIDKACPYCNKEPLSFIKSEPIDNKFFEPCDDDVLEEEPLSTFNYFVKQKLYTESNNPLNIDTIPFFFYDNEESKITRINYTEPATKFFNPQGNPIKTFIRKGTQFQTNATKKFLGLSVNKERKIVASHLVIFGTYLTTLSIIMNLITENPDYASALKFSLLGTLFVTFLLIQLMQR